MIPSNQRKAIVSTTIVAIAYIIYMLVRVSIAANGNLSLIALIGQQFSNIHQLPSYLARVPLTGYDGQFFLRLAMDPFDFHTWAFGMKLDSLYRIQRIGYPFFAWILSGGTHRFVPMALVEVNIIAVSLIGYFGTLLASGSRYAILVGISLATYCGYAFSVGHDLAEPTAAALLLAGLFALRKNKFWTGSVLLSLAPLARETELIVPFSIGIVCLFQLIKGQKPILPFQTFVIPGAVFIIWQIVIALARGGLPLSGDVSSNLGIFLLSPIRGVIVHFESLVHGTIFFGVVTRFFKLPFHVSAWPADALWFLQLIIISFVVVLAGKNIILSKAPSYEKVSWVIMLFLALSISGATWDNSAYFRYIDMVWLLSILIYSATPKTNYTKVFYLGSISFIFSVLLLVVNISGW